MIIDGKQIAKTIREEIKRCIQPQAIRKPGLAFLIIGNDPGSRTYVQMKKKACEDVGFYSETLEFNENVKENELLEEIKRLSLDKTIDGILVQQPLPKHISPINIIMAVPPEKDVDGFHPINIGKMLLGIPGGFHSCTPLGIMTLLEKSNIDVSGKHAVILGRSNIVGKPLAALLMQKSKHANATVTIAHSGTKNLKELTKTADILIAAIGKTEFVTADMVKKGAVVIDVGINRTENNTLVGDVDFANVFPIASHITKVPGGIGPMTIAMLLSNTLLSYQRCTGQ